MQEVGGIRRGSDQDSGVHCTTTEETDVSINSPTVMGMNVTACTDITLVNDDGENGDVVVVTEEVEEENNEISENDENDVDIKPEISKC